MSLQDPDDEGVAGRFGRTLKANTPPIRARGLLTSVLTMRVIEFRKGLLLDTQVLIQDPDGNRVWCSAGDEIRLDIRIDID